MGRIAVLPGERVAVGQFVGVSGGDNGDHLHLETRDLQPAGNFLVTDPRGSFLLAFLAAGVAPPETPSPAPETPAAPGAPPTAPPMPDPTATPVLITVWPSFLTATQAPTPHAEMAASAVAETPAAGEAQTSDPAADTPGQTLSIPTPSAGAPTPAASEPIPVQPQPAPEQDPLPADAESNLEPAALNRPASAEIRRPDAMSD